MQIKKERAVWHDAKHQVLLTSISEVLSTGKTADNGLKSSESTKVQVIFNEKSKLFYLKATLD
jgi:hypothetical protein